MLTHHPAGRRGRTAGSNCNFYSLSPMTDRPERDLERERFRILRGSVYLGEEIIFVSHSNISIKCPCAESSKTLMHTGNRGAAAAQTTGYKKD